MNVKLGPAGNCTEADNTQHSVKMVKDLGLQAQEIEFVRSVYLDVDQAKKLGKIAEKNDVSLSAHGSYYINLCSDTKQEKSMDRILKAAKVAEGFNGIVVVFHPGYYQDLEEQEAYDRVKDACERMQEQIGDIKLGLETTGKFSQFGSLDEVISISEEVEKCVPVVDFGHLYARGQGNIDYGEVLDKIEKLNLNQIHTHFTNLTYSDKGEKKHITIDNEEPKFEPLADEIIERELDITIISESPILEKDSLKMKEIFENKGHFL